MAVSGNFAYVAAGATMQVVTIDNPSALEIINSIDIPGYANGVTVSGKYAYVAADESGFQVIDIDDPSNPIIIGSLDTPGSARSIAIAGSFAVMADGDSGIQIIDISIPTTPHIIGSVGTIDYAHDVKVAGNYAFVADGYSGLQVIDFGQPTSPKIIGGVDTWHIAIDIFISGSYAYIADYHGGLQIIDISLPGNPVIAGTVGTTDRALGISVSGNFAYMADGDRVQIIDVSTPPNPQIYGSIDTPGDARSITVLGIYAYVADSESGVQVIDTRIPTGPQIVGSVGTPSNPRDIAISGDYAFVAIGQDGVLLVDISNSCTPQIIGSIDTPGEARGITVNGSYAYVADHGSGLQIIDVSAPKTPRIIGFVDTPGLAQDVAVTSTHAYIADYHYDLQVIDISNPNIPVIVGSERTLSGLATEIVVSGNYAYVACDSGGPHVVDINIPTTPERISTLSGYESYSLDVTANYAYITGFSVEPGGIYSSGFKIIDVSIPSTPQNISSIGMPDYPQRIDVSGNYAYVNNGYGGIHVIDISDLSSPQIIGTILTPGSGYDVTVSGNFAYVSDSESGLIIVALPIELNPTSFNETTLFLTLPNPVLAGSYTLRAFNDNQNSELIGAVSFTDNLQILSSKALVVAGGGPNAPGEIWEETKLSANNAYDILVHEGYGHESIWYLSMETGNPYVDGPALHYALDDAINNWAADASELVIFFVDHGLPDNFIIYANSGYSEKLDVNELDYWLDSIQQNMPGALTLIYDACNSGTFASKLIPPLGKDRIIITGASDEPAYFRGEDSFSFQFWEQILLKEGNVGYAFSQAKNIMQGYQSALLNTNGNTLTNEAEDISIANSHIIRRGQPIYLKPAPTIGSVINNQALNGSFSAALWVSNVLEAESVWAKIIPPDINPDIDGVPITDLPAIELQDTDKDGTYDGTYNGFVTEGTYTIIINAQSSQEIYSYVKEGMVTQIIPSSPVYTSVTQMNGADNISADDYEEDDTYPQANVITLNDLDVQPHNFHDLGDADWVKFYALSGQTYSIKASNVNVICDVVIELFDSNGITRLVGPWNEAGNGGDELLEWTCTRDDVYYVKLSNANETFGENCKYDLKLYRPIGPLAGFVSGLVEDASTLQALANVQIKTDLNQTTLSLANGSYLMVHPPGAFTITAQKTGYNSKDISGVAISEGGSTALNITLMPFDTDGDGIPDVIETASVCLNANNADTDDDCIPDGVEDANHDGSLDFNETDPCDIDTDNDGIQDGTELGYTLSDANPDTNTGIFQPDLDPSTTTNPLDDDTDNDGVLDGEEDANHNGKIDLGETDPNQSDNNGLPWLMLLLLGE
ncbi:hypothetical protein N9219_02870 [bacterium]|nr:hypothetical protein [bacterium]